VIDGHDLSIDTRNMAAVQRVSAVRIETADVFFCMENKIFPWMLLRQSDKMPQRFGYAKGRAMKPSGRNL